MDFQLSLLMDFRNIFVNGLSDIFVNGLSFVTSCLVVAVQTCMEWIPIKKNILKWFEKKALEQIFF